MFRKQGRMEDSDQVLQHQIRTKREIFVVRLVSRIASINLFFLECLELCIRSIVFPNRGHGLVRFLVVFYQPDVGMLSLVEHRLEGEGHTSALGVC